MRAVGWCVESASRAYGLACYIASEQYSQVQQGMSLSRHYEDHSEIKCTRLQVWVRGRATSSVIVVPTRRACDPRFDLICFYYWKQ